MAAAVCEQPGRRDLGFTLEAMTQPLEALGYEVLAELPVLGVFDRGRVKQDLKVMKSARELGRKLTLVD